MHAGILIFWCSKIQTEIALSTCEAECTTLSTAMREVMTLIKMLEDLSVTCDVITAPPLATCKAFEDNQSFIVVAESKKPPERTKHIALKCHQFCSLVDEKIININCVDAKKKLADTLTKPIEANQFLKLRQMLIG